MAMSSFLQYFLKNILSEGVHVIDAIWFHNFLIVIYYDLVLFSKGKEPIFDILIKFLTLIVKLVTIQLLSVTFACLYLLIFDEDVYLCYSPLSTVKLKLLNSICQYWFSETVWFIDVTTICCIFSAYLFFPVSHEIVLPVCSMFNWIYRYGAWPLEYT